MAANESPEDLGDRCKALEDREAQRTMLPNIPVVARLDGRAFHTFCRNLHKPYDSGMTESMIETTRALVDEFKPSIGYCQSDEITLIWPKPDLFNGRFQKMTSVLAGFASTVFTLEVIQRLPGKENMIPCFDCRVWQVPTLTDALDVLYFREADCVKNSVSMLAQANFSHNQLQNKNRKEMMDMLILEKGINWNDCPVSQKRGTYLKRVVSERTLTEEERMKIPEKNRPLPDMKFTRSKVEIMDYPPLRQVIDPISVLFHK